MKKLTFGLLIMCGLSPLFSFAQLRVAPSFGINFATAQLSDEAKEALAPIDESYKNKLITTFQIGALGEYALNDVLSLQSGLILNGKGTNLKAGISAFGVTLESANKIRLTYLSLPLTAKYYLMETDGFLLSGWGGLVLDFAVAGKIKNVTQVGDEKETNTETISFGSSTNDDLKGSDVSLTLGVTADSQDIPLQLKFALVQGLVNAFPYDEGEYSWRNFGINLSAAYFFELD